MVRLADITGEDKRVLVPAGRRRQRVLVAADQPDPVSGVEKGMCRRRADAATGARDDDGFSHWSRPFLRES